MDDRVIDIVNKIKDKEKTKAAIEAEAEALKYSTMASELAKDVYEVICKYENIGLTTALGALEVVKWILIKDASTGELNDE